MKNNSERVLMCFSDMDYDESAPEEPPENEEAQTAPPPEDRTSEDRGGSTDQDGHFAAVTPGKFHHLEISLHFKSSTWSNKCHYPKNRLHTGRFSDLYIQIQLVTVFRWPDSVCSYVGSLCS